MKEKLLEWFKEKAWEFTPTPQRVREEFLDEVRGKVDFYKPRIEEKCGVYLGKISVKDRSEWLSDKISVLLNVQLLREFSSRGEGFPTKEDYEKLRGKKSLAKAIYTLPEFVLHSFKGFEMQYDESCLYVPFNYRNRIGDIGFKERRQIMDCAVVHELSHALWECLGGANPSEEHNSKLYGEGFATFCELIYFKKFYPEGTPVRTNLDLSDFYRECLKKIYEISMLGRISLLDIPEKWQEYERENLKPRSLESQMQINTRAL